MNGSIEKLIEIGDVDNLEQSIREYEKTNPYDADIYSYKLTLSLIKNDPDSAYRYAVENVRKYPLSADAIYYLAYVEELKKEYVMAYYHYKRAAFIYGKCDPEAEKSKQSEEHAEEMLKLFDDYIASGHAGREELIRQRDLFNAVAEMDFHDYGLTEDMYKSCLSVIGSFVQISLSERRYVGLHDDCWNRFDWATNGFDPETEFYEMDLLHNKGEFLNVTEGDHFLVEDNGVPDEADFLISIASDDRNNGHRFKRGDGSCLVAQYYDKSFGYYRVKNHTEIISNNTSFYGHPVPLVSSPKRKKLVMSIFVDGLSGELLRGENLEKYMPNTYGFFSKGTICENVYACGDWTYPSIANIETGLYTKNHMMIHPQISISMPEDIKTLDERYHDEGYYTARLNGDWRIVPDYGYSRGVDRYLYRHATSGYAVDDVITDAVDHISTFEETDQYLWISLGDLHNVADGFDLPMFVQSSLKLEDRIYEPRSITSVKTDYSTAKINQYIEYMKYVDRWLKVLYDLITEKYRDEDIVISLFSDHGQGYLVPDDKHFFSKGRSKVAFMFRGADIPEGVRSDEVISTVDYYSVMSGLCGLGSDVHTDGQLPVLFGGDREREYAISESIHPHDNYQAAVNFKDGCFYFINPVETNDEGRFPLADYSCWLEDLDGNILEDEDRKKHYLDMILKHIAPLLIYES